MRLGLSGCFVLDSPLILGSEDHPILRYVYIPYIRTCSCNALYRS
ncbi:hypothetical protein AG1IA_08059 [Rhizoctonia solani AG-1 IA]|uniref:Uncharacterized protein n=1 Tax=Thanatephorus cucumeris (strain AG1-IA) TaxID=983506 RepID=L8WNJ1_THACA|nr:hypothetical protein AG1IA_08059 [Rhizoctonia solani AG-1 IA]